MKKLTGDEAAQPCIESINHNGVIEVTTSEAGMTIRQQFAMAAMQGLMAVQEKGHDDWAAAALHASEIAVMVADATIAALNNTPNPNALLND